MDRRRHVKTQLVWFNVVNGADHAKKYLSDIFNVVEVDSGVERWGDFALP